MAVRAVWVPDLETRLDREVVRGRGDFGEVVTRAKEKIVSLLARNGLEKPAGLGGNWTVKHRAWLEELAGGERLDWRLRVALRSELSYLAACEAETEYLDEHVQAVAASDRKGHITRQGPRRLRRLLAQAVQMWVRWDPKAAEGYRRLVGKSPKRKRIAKVAMMRRLAIRLWHAALDARGPSAAEAVASAETRTS